MKTRHLYLATAILAALSLASCGALSSLYKQGGRTLQAVGRTVTGR